jgi:nicotinic acid mononucleotide adenylyltransferase
MKRVVITFGRFNPPTTGHEKLLDAVKKAAGTDDYKIYTSHSQDKKGKNPLSSEDKVEYMKTMFPQHKNNIMYDMSLKTIIHVLQSLQGDYADVALVVGSDRVQEMDALIQKYNGKDYTFRKLETVSAGERDPDADDVSGMSASKMRAFVKANDINSFRDGLPITVKNDEDFVIKMFNHISSLLPGN